MSVITISRGSYSQGKLVAEKLAEKLGYSCASQEVLLAAAEHFNIPEAKLAKAIKDAPSFIDRFSKEKERYVRIVRAALLDYVKKDGVVYHGMSGQYLLKDIEHVLKIRIHANREYRVGVLMKREKISKSQAVTNLMKIDDDRRKWGRYIYGIDPHHPNLYDLVIGVDTLKIDDAVDLISHTVGLPSYETTDESRKRLNDLALAAEVHALLLDLPVTEVTSEDGSLHVFLTAPLNQKDRLDNQIRDITQKIKAVNHIRLVFEQVYKPFGKLETIGSGTVDSPADC